LNRGARRPTLARVTVLEVIKRSAGFLARRGVESPRLQVELLLSHVLKLPRMRLYLEFERVLSGAELEVLRALIQRRGGREPLQHLLGSVSFCGVEIETTRAALIPRPETEQLAELAWNHVARECPGAASLVDFGTGTGCLAIAIALHAPAASVHALDISGDALALARRNAARHQLDLRIAFHLGDGLEALPAATRVEVIVANPPYIPTADIDALEPEVRDHDPRLALDGGADGLDCFRALARLAPGFLNPGGAFIAEFGDGQAVALRGLFSRAPWRVDRVARDLSGRERFLIARVAGP